MVFKPPEHSRCDLRIMLLLIHPRAACRLLVVASIPFYANGTDLNVNSTTNVERHIFECRHCESLKASLDTLQSAGIPSYVQLNEMHATENNQEREYGSQIVYLACMQVSFCPATRGKPITD